MPLVGENRILVKYGLIVLSKTQRLGYQEMCNVGNIAINNGSIPSATTVAFQIAPRINAAGRMSHAKHAFELMRETDKSLAIKQAQELEKQNLQRREITELLTAEVEQIIEKEHKDKSFILIADENYPVGIVGIIAGRVAQKYGKPTGIFTKYDNESRGSFRSVEGVHILDVLNACSEHLGKFGGHEQAAGATIQNDDFDDFVIAANEFIYENIDLNKNKKGITANCEITFENISRELSTELQKFEPFGESNEEPIFMLKNLVIADIRTVGSDKKHLKLKLAQEGFAQSYDAIGFGIGNLINELSKGDLVDAVVNIQENEWMGNVSVQFNIVDIMKK
jgi:single-stranded-DNA-specific exonuclease